MEGVFPSTTKEPQMTVAIKIIVPNTSFSFFNRQGVVIAQSPATGITKIKWADQPNTWSIDHNTPIQPIGGEFK